MCVNEREQSLPFYNISSKRQGFVRAQGGRGKHNKICLRLSANRIVCTSGRREDGEKSKQKCHNKIALFGD